MARYKTIITGIIVVAFVGLLVLPAYAGRSYRYHRTPKGGPPGLVQYHRYYAPEESGKIVGDTVTAILGGESKPASDAEKAEPVKRTYRRRSRRAGWHKNLIGRLR